MRTCPPRRWRDAIDAERVTFFAGVPTIVHDLLRRHAENGFDTSVLRAVISGGSAVPTVADRERPISVERAPRPGLGHDRDEPAGRALLPAEGCGRRREEASWLVKSGRVVAGLEARVIGEDGEPLRP